MVGNLAASRKSGLFKWASRLGSRVSRLLTSIVASTDDLVGSASSAVTVPVVLLKVPRTVDTMRWRTANWTLACAGSISQVDAYSGAAAVKMKPTTVASSERRMVSSFSLALDIYGALPHRQAQPRLT